MTADSSQLSLSEVEKLYQSYKDQKLNLDMTRGKPGADQLDLASALLNNQSYISKGGVDCRNYGGLDGLPEAKETFAPMLGCKPEEVIVGGNSSLTLMHDAVMRAMVYGVPGSPRPWCKEEKVKFLCPVPGYDRHFGICESLGIEMVAVKTDDEGPVMEEVTALVAKDPTIKGMWCVPKYGNPTGVTYSDGVVQELASMVTAAPDFRIMWDNAYAVHHLGKGVAPLLPLLQACQEAGHPDRALMFASTSKITFAGSGVSFLAASDANRADILAKIGKQTIGPDKLNILRHVGFFKSFDGILAHMDKHASLLKPKFDVVDEVFTSGLKGLATWSKPEGGYFVNLDTKPGLAAKVVQLAADAGVKLTKAGATFPYGKDPQDSNIRIAPSLPPLGEVKTAMEVVVVCVQLASLM